MLSKRAICCAILMAYSVCGGAAQKEARKEARRAPQKTETIACRLGTEDRHARIAVVLVGGKTDSFAYYSKWKPRTCSIYLQRNRDMFSKWADNGNLTTVNLEKGAFLIEHNKGQYHFIFRDIDRLYRSCNRAERTCDDLFSSEARPVRASIAESTKHVTRLDLIYRTRLCFAEFH